MSFFEDFNRNQGAIGLIGALNENQTRAHSASAARNTAATAANTAAAAKNTAQAAKNTAAAARAAEAQARATEAMQKEMSTHNTSMAEIERQKIREASEHNAAILKIEEQKIADAKKAAARLAIFRSLLIFGSSYVELLEKELS